MLSKLEWKWLLFTLDKCPLDKGASRENMPCLCNSIQAHKVGEARGRTWEASSNQQSQESIGLLRRCLVSDKYLEDRI